MRLFRIRPILWSIDHEADPPRMTVCLPGEPRRFATIELEGATRSREETALRALSELETTEPEIYEAIAGQERTRRPD